MKTVRMGILGASAIAPVAITKPAARIPELDVVAVAARAQHRADEFARLHGLRKSFGNYKQLLGDDSIDAVYIATPNALHFPWAMEAIRAGKHVLCEKPLALNAAEAKEIRKAAAATHLVVSEGFHYRYHPAFRRALEVVQSGELGRLTEIHIDFHFDARQNPADIRWSAELGGGALLDLGCYAVHAARSVFGAEPDNVRAEMSWAESGVDSAVRAELSFGPGRLSTFACSINSIDQISTMRIVGSLGSLQLNHPFTPQWGHELRISTRSGRRSETTVLATTYQFQLDEFVRAVNGGGGDRLLPLSDAVANATVLDSVRLAASRTLPTE